MQFVVLDDEGRILRWLDGERRFVGTIAGCPSVFNRPMKARRRIQWMRESIAAGLITMINPDTLRIVPLEEK